MNLTDATEFSGDSRNSSLSLRKGSVPPMAQLGRRGILALLAAALLSVGAARADTIILKTATGTLPVEGTIVSIDSAELVYVSASTDRQTHKPIDSVLQIKAPNEPKLSAAEQAYADGKWSEAAANYQAALNSTSADWVKNRAMVRLIEAAAQSPQLAPASAGAYVPESKGVKSPLATAAIARSKKKLADAKALYDKMLSDANAAYRTAYTAAVKQVTNELDKALKAAMDAADLDEANRIDAVTKAARAGGDWRVSASKKPTSPSAAAVLDRGDKSLLDARKVFDTSVAEGYMAYRRSEAEARMQLIDELDAALKTAMKAGDLEDANRIDAVKKAAERAEASRRSEDEKAKTVLERKRQEEKDADDERAIGGASEIVFVCDASGSMLNKMATLKDLLQKAIGGLRPTQSFNILFFQDERWVALDKSQLTSADAAGKRNAYKFLDDVTTSGTGDPIPGLMLAFQQHPQVVNLLTDGDFPDNKTVQNKITELNRDHRVKINTIAFIDNRDADADSVKGLNQIAKDNGGICKRMAE